MRMLVTIAAILVFDLSKQWEKSRRERMGVIELPLFPVRLHKSLSQYYLLDTVMKSQFTETNVATVLDITLYREHRETHRKACNTPNTQKFHLFSVIPLNFDWVSRVRFVKELFLTS